MPETPKPDARFHEIHVSRLVLREPDSGRVRAVLELKQAPEREDDVPAYPRPGLTLFTAAGDTALVIELDEVGRPRVSIGHPDRGTTIIFTTGSLALWDGGNEVAAIDSADGGRVQLRDAAGKVVMTLPTDAV